MLGVVSLVTTEARHPGDLNHVEQREGQEEPALRSAVYTTTNTAAVVVSYSYGVPGKK